MVKLTSQKQGSFFSTKVTMHKLIYCLAMGLLMLFSAPAEQAVTRGNSTSIAQDHASLFDFTMAADASLNESAIPAQQRTVTGMLAGVGLMGFVVANCKRRK